ncbi:MAG: MlaD family protein [Tepidisphaeraceae bacterium]|jgi:phospholipid/cholesterol/gamma-HCH transport system substrate-binding protein
MTQRNRNMMVGLTVLVALVLLAWMILRFSDAPFRLFAKRQMPVVLVAISSEGVSEGSPVYYKGVNVGRVLTLERSPDQRSVLIHVVIDADPPLPSNLEGKIRTTLLGGSASISLLLVRNPSTRPADGTAEVMSADEREPDPVGQLAEDQRIVTRYVGVDLMPKEFVNLANDLTMTSKEIRRFSQDFRDAKLFEQVKKNLETLQVSLEAATRAFQSADKLLNDEKMRKDLTATLDNFRATSESARRIGLDLEKLSGKANTHLDELADNGNKVLITARAELEKTSQKMGARLEQLAAVIDNVEQITRKVNDGKGTAGAMINDPAVYETLLDASKELKLTIQDFRRLIDQWEKDGISFKLK